MGPNKFYEQSMECNQRRNKLKREEKEGLVLKA